MELWGSLWEGGLLGPGERSSSQTLAEKRLLLGVWQAVSHGDEVSLISMATWETPHRTRCWSNCDPETQNKGGGEGNRGSLSLYQDEMRRSLSSVVISSDVGRNF